MTQRAQILFKKKKLNFYSDYRISQFLFPIHRKYYLATLIAFKGVNITIKI